MTKRKVKSTTYHPRLEKIRNNPLSSDGKIRAMRPWSVTMQYGLTMANDFYTRKYSAARILDRRNKFPPTYYTGGDIDDIGKR